MRKRFIMWLMRVLKVELDPKIEKHIVEHSVLEFVELEVTSELNRFDLERATIDKEILRSMHLSAVDNLKNQLVDGNYIGVDEFDNPIDRTRKFRYTIKVAKPTNNKAKWRR